MLDHKIFLNDPDTVFAGLTSRGVDKSTLSDLATLIDERRALIQNVEGLRQELNEATAAVSKEAKAGNQAAVEEARATLKGLKSKIKTGEDAQKTNDDKIHVALVDLPNLPHESVPVGADEADNREERVVGEEPVFDFAPKPHWELGESLGILDFDAAAKISGARFVLYRGAGARLERALANFMLDHARENGFTEIIPPLLVRNAAMEGAGQYPKFKGESFETLDNEFSLIPTAEVPLVNMHRDEIIERPLPLRYTALTACFRREAGAAGRDTRGLIRLHQFNKVELVALTTPENSAQEHERLTGVAESVLKKLGLRYRVMTLCTKDMSFTSTKTYDLEVWLPGQDNFREISSCSNCTDFQARRASIRFRPAAQEGGKKKPKPQLAHTLNGSSLAVGRTVVAILENYQQEDGTIKIPEVLVPYFGANQITPEA